MCSSRPAANLSFAQQVSFNEQECKLGIMGSNGLLLKVAWGLQAALQLASAESHAEHETIKHS